MEAGTGMIRHLAFFEAIDRVTRGEGGTGYDEVLAGALVLRLYDLRQLAPGSVRPVTSPYKQVRDAVCALSPDSGVRHALVTVLRGLLATAPSGETNLERALQVYAAALMRAGQSALAEDVRRSTRTECGRPVGTRLRRCSLGSGGQWSGHG